MLSALTVDGMLVCLCVFVTDEIMQKESSPLFAADIITELKRQFAFLSGKCSYICIYFFVHETKTLYRDQPLKTHKEKEKQMISQ